MSSSLTLRNNNSNSPQRNENDSSAFYSTYDSSINFITGDYEHNIEILDNLYFESIRDDVDEDRLIHLATKKFARESDYQSRREIVVASAELNGEDSSRQLDMDASQVNSSEHNGILQNVFSIFKGDDSYMEVSREEVQRVRVMHKRFREGAEFSFNYNVLLIIASLIAALGLGGNSTATVIASMLVSPLMGPVMGMAYGATILDFKLFSMSVKTELLSLFVCVAVGSLVTGCMAPFYELPKEWPTKEMEARATMESFYIGIPIAFASGLGVAVSVLDEQTSSLVGVAISASLLPPAINAGMLWTTYFFFDADANEEHNFGMEGLISLGLTLINILMIILSSMLMFRIKERLPIKNKKVFWTDLGLARKIYENRALYNTETRGAMRRVGQRASKLFRSSNTVPDLTSNRTTSDHTTSDRDNWITAIRNRTTSDQTKRRGSTSAPNSRSAPNNRRYSGTTLEVPDGSEEAAAARARALSTVEEERLTGEERLSGYYSS
mmetsp:Transcript_10029/g.25032  ORF Transcript_10029/g.25032 Transcript_10029/m.25032 type:complete len:497 (-) Transcript_10029:142-1632(-)